MKVLLQDFQIGKKGLGELRHVKELEGKVMVYLSKDLRLKGLFVLIENL